MTDIVTITEEDIVTVIGETRIDVVTVGITGPQGTQGAQGDPGEGVPAGGTTGQVLRKTSNADYDTEWSSSGGGGGVSDHGDLDGLHNFGDHAAADISFDDTVMAIQTVGAVTGNVLQDIIDDMVTNFASVVTGLITGKSDVGHTHIIADTTGLQAALDAKAGATHTHAISDVTGLQTALDGKASSSHTHNASTIFYDDASVASDTSGAVTGNDVQEIVDAVVTELIARINAKQESDSDLTTIAGLSPTNDDILQRKAGAWTNRTLAQLRTDLAINRNPFKLGINDYRLLSQQVAVGGYTTASPSSTATNSNGTVTYIPFVVTEEMTIDELAIHAVVTNAGASAVVRLGIYADNGSGRPGNVVVDAGTASINTSALKQLSFTPVTLTPGYYFAALVAQGLDTAGTNPTFSISVGSAMVGDPSPAASNNMFPWLNTSGISGAFANNPTVYFTRTTQGRAFNIWARRSA